MEDEFKDYQIVKTVKTCKNHFWVVSEKQDKNSNLESINCRNCPIGANIDKNLFFVKGGKICSKNLTL